MAFDRLADTLLAAPAADITFTGIDQTYKDLIIIFKLRCTRAALDDIRMRLGHGSLDTGANYGNFTYYGGTSSSTVNEASGSAGMWCGVTPGSTDTAGAFCLGHIELPDYANPNTSKGVLVRSTYAVPSSIYMAYGGGSWKNTTQSIDQIRFYPPVGPNWAAGSRVTLYGRG